MGDVFKEQLIKAEQTTKDKILRGLVIAATVLISLVALALGGAFVGPLIILAVIWGCIYVQAMFKKEYEYSLTNEELDIDVIYNKERRKRLTSVNLKNMNIMASIKDERHKDSILRAQHTMDASDGKETNDTYVIVASTSKGLTRILITPNEQMLGLMYKQAPNKVMKYKG
jgi:hypothetical protein